MPKPVAVLKRAREFNKIFQQGNNYSEKRFSIYFIPAKLIKIGIMISRKQGNAVQRNRARRLVKEYFRLNQEKIKAAQIVIVGRAPLVTSYVETEKKMLKLLHKVGLEKRRSRPEE